MARHSAKPVVSQRLEVLVACALLALGAILDLVPSGSKIRWLFQVVLYLGIALAGWYSIKLLIRGHKWRKTRERARRCNYRICPYCFYSLQGAEDSGRCSECGEEFDPVSLREAWEERPT